MLWIMLVEGVYELCPSKLRVFICCERLWDTIETKNICDRLKEFAPQDEFQTTHLRTYSSIQPKVGYNPTPKIWFLVVLNRYISFKPMKTTLSKGYAVYRFGERDFYLYVYTATANIVWKSKTKEWSFFLFRTSFNHRPFLKMGDNGTIVRLLKIT